MSSSLHGFKHGTALHGALDTPDPIPAGTVPATGVAYDGDALLILTGDGGEVQISGGEVLRSGGLHNAWYLSLFGGDEDDTGLPGDPNNAWINYLVTDPAEQYRGQTGRVLNSTSASSGALALIETTVKNDIAWMLTAGVATSVEVSVSIPAPKRVRIVCTIQAEGDPSTFAYVGNWNAKS